jgi:hypothetical protein
MWAKTWIKTSESGVEKLPKWENEEKKIVLSILKHHPRAVTVYVHFGTELVSHNSYLNFDDAEIAMRQIVDVIDACDWRNYVPRFKR